MAWRCLFAVTSSLLAACSLTRPDLDACTSDSECHRGFGIGHVCDDGFCAAAEADPRCATTFPPDLMSNARAYVGRVVIGTIIDDSLETHVARSRAVELTIRDANEVGGLPGGHDLALVVCTNAEDPGIDSLNQVEATERVAIYLKEAIGTPAIVGPPSSNATQVAFENLDESVLLISPSASSPALTDLEPPASDELPGRLWRTAPPDSIQGELIAQDLMARAVTSLAIVVEEGPYGEGIRDAVLDRLPMVLASNVETFMFATASDQGNVTAELNNIEMDEVLFASSQTLDAVSFLRFAAGPNAESLQTAHIFLTDSAANGDFARRVEDIPEIFPRLRGTRPAPPTGVIYDAFTARYGVTFDEDVTPFSFTAHAFDAGWLALGGIAWAKLNEDEVSAVSIGRGLRHVSRGESLSLGQSAWPDLLDAFEVGESVDVEGASGPLNYDSLTEETTGPFEIWGLDEEGELVTLES